MVHFFFVLIAYVYHNARFIKRKEKLPLFEFQF